MMRLNTMHFCILLASLILGINAQNTSLDKMLLHNLFNTRPQCDPGAECIPFYLCKNGTAKEGGEDLIDVRIDTENISPCSTPLEVCCRTEQQITASTYATTIAIHSRLPELDKCGIRHVDGVGYRISGNNDGEVQFGEFPWMVAVLAHATKDGIQRTIFQCGGSIIHQFAVLTVAHCVAEKDKNSLIARAGEWNTQAEDESMPHQDRNIAQVIVHNGFDRETSINNIAIMFLQTPFEFTSAIQTICLPPATQSFDNVDCVATGWGKDAFGRMGKYHEILKSVTLPVVPNKRCEELLRKTRLSEYFELDEGFMCAGGIKGRDTCKGDGGSPLVCPIPGTQNQYYQGGVVAWGIACNDEDVPGVYMNVAKYRSWIDMTMQSQNYDSSSYIPK